MNGLMVLRNGIIIQKNIDTFYYNGKDSDAVQHYLDFQQRPDRTVNCAGCPGGCSDYVVPEARDGFVALPDEDLGNCLSDADDSDKLLNDTQIIIVSVAAGIVLLLMVVILVICCKRKRKSQAMKKYENMTDVEESQYGTTAK
eukprot:999308_1